MSRILVLRQGSIGLLATLLLAIGLLMPHPVIAAGDADTIAALKSILTSIDKVEAAIKAKDVPAAQAAEKTLDDTWFANEDAIRTRTRDNYVNFEAHQRELRAALNATPFDPVPALVATGTLRDATNQTIAAFQSGAGSTPAQPLTASDTQASMQALVAALDQSDKAIDSGDIPTAIQGIVTAQQHWLDVEGIVKVKSADTYTKAENNLALVEGSLRASPPDKASAKKAIGELKTDLAPYAENATSYTAFDAGITLLREGMEALVIIAALLAFLKRSRNGDKQIWVWGGAGVGFIASLIVAMILQIVLSGLANGTSRELMEGITGLVAAVMLIGVSYWLHGKTNPAVFQKYVFENTAMALKSGSYYSLAFIAFLAVFREGSETALFLIGMASSISMSDMLLGLGGAATILAVMCVLMLGFGVRIPMGPFFTGTSILLFYLAFKFIGAGVHSLQVSGLASATPAPIPDLTLIGVFPTWETLIPQLTLLLGLGAYLLLERMRAPRTEAVAA